MKDSDLRASLGVENVGEDEDNLTEDWDTI